MCGSRFEKLCYTQHMSSVYASVPLRLILYPLTLWDREALCFDGNTALATQCTQPHKTHHRSVPAGARQWTGNGIYPLLEVTSCLWVKLFYLSTDRRFFCASVLQRVLTPFKSVQNMR